METGPTSTTCSIESECRDTSPLIQLRILNVVTPIDQLLLDAVLDNNHDKIEKIVGKLSKDEIQQFRYESENEHKITIMVKACITETVTEQTLDKLLSSIKSKYGTVRFIDTELFGWEPIHHLAEIANPKKLKVLLDQLDNVNALTYFSENALHVLLQYGKSRSAIDIQLYRNNNASDAKRCTIIDTEKDNIAECAKLLIDKGVNINQANIWNETPIYLAIGNVYPKVIQELLKVNNINLENHIGAITVGEYLRRTDMLPNSTYYVHESPVSRLFAYLKSGNEDWFLQYNNGNIRDHVNDLESKDGGTMLQMCLTKGFFEYLKDECYENKLLKVDIRDSPMLKIFNSKGLKRYIVHLLDNDADIFKTTEKFDTPVLEYAAVRGYYPFVAILLQHKNSKIGYDRIFTTLSKLFSGEFNLLENHEHYEKCVLYLLLNKLIAIVSNKYQTEQSSSNSESQQSSSNSQSEQNSSNPQSEIHKLTGKKMTILNKILCKLNLESNDNVDDSEIICQLLHLGASLTEKVDNGKSLVIEKIHPNILRSHINDCIQNNEFNYGSIIQDDDKVYSETKTIHFLTKNEQKKDVLVHPLFIYFLHEKWSRISLIFYLDLAFYSLFVVSIYFYMICLGEGIASPVINFMSNLFYILLIFHILKEAFQLFFLFYLKYFYDPSNYFELFLIGNCIFTIFYPNIYSRVIAILTATIIFSVMWGQLPGFTKYTIIFGSSKYFLEYIVFYFVQFIAFAICFYILFPFKTEKINDEKSSLSNSTSNFMSNSTSNSTNIKTTEQIMGDLMKNLFFTIVHFTGEFSERVLDPEEYPVFGRVITIVFIFCITIILNNLLVGLIVADMDDIQKSGRLYKQVKMATFIERSNTFIKRIHDFKSFDFIEGIIDSINIFKKNKKKILDLNKINLNELFDDDNKQLLREIRNQNAFNRHVLKDVYDLIIK